MATTGLQVESILFPPSVKPPGASATFFLGGADHSFLLLCERFGDPRQFRQVYWYWCVLEDKAISSLAVKWKGKTAQELTDSVEFYRDIVTGPFEKFAQVTMILPLTGKQYAEKVSGKLRSGMEALGIYTDADAKTMTSF
ncbi:putative chalcone isomerase [Helianthus annuus]|nr:putative chalcone isomerase [Helianthus annuus]